MYVFTYMAYPEGIFGNFGNSFHCSPFPPTTLITNVFCIPSGSICAGCTHGQNLIYVVVVLVGSSRWTRGAVHVQMFQRAADHYQKDMEQEYFDVQTLG